MLFPVLRNLPFRPAFVSLSLVLAQSLAPAAQAEEPRSGAQAMIEDGLFSRFPTPVHPVACCQCLVRGGDCRLVPQHGLRHAVDRGG